MAAPYAYPPRRPIGVVILAVLVILAGIFLTLISLLLVLAALVLIPEIGAIGVVVALAILIFSIMLLVAGFGLYNLRPWAWWLAMIVLVLQILANASAYAGFVSTGGASTGTLISLAIPVLILVYLIVVRKHFRSTPAGAPVYGPPPPPPR